MPWKSDLNNIKMHYRTNISNDLGLVNGNDVCYLKTKSIDNQNDIKIFENNQLRSLRDSDLEK